MNLDPLTLLFSLIPINTIMLPGLHVGMSGGGGSNKREGRDRVVMFTGEPT